MKLHEEIGNKEEVYFKDKEIDELRRKLERFDAVKEQIGAYTCLFAKIFFLYSFSYCMC